MSKDYQDLQFLQQTPGDSEDFKMKLWFSQPSQRLVCALDIFRTGLLVLIIILIVSFRDPGEKPADQTLAFKVGNLSEKVTSQLARLSQDGAKVTETLQKMDAALKDIQTDPAISTLQNGIQRALSAISRLSERVRKLQVNGSQEEEGCPAEWSTFQLSCYFYSAVGKSWSNSKVACEEKTSHMVVINSKGEQEYLFGITKGKYTWIGLTDVSGHWKWVDGTRYDSALKNWISDQPDEFYGHGLGGGEDCAHLHHNGKWNDDHCSREYAYLCEMEM